MMDIKEILVKLHDVVGHVLGDDDIVLAEATVLQDLDGWSSLAQVQVLTAVEHEFGMRFTLKEIISIQTVGDIIRAISNSVEQTKA